MQSRKQLVLWVIGWFQKGYVISEDRRLHMVRGGHKEEVPFELDFEGQFSLQMMWLGATLYRTVHRQNTSTVTASSVGQLPWSLGS